MSLKKKKHESTDEEITTNISLNKVKQYLGVSDMRTVAKWCKQNRVFVFKIGKERYVNRLEFELCVEQPFIEHLVKAHPENWEEIYLAHKAQDYIKIYKERYNKEFASKVKFKSPGKSGDDFLKSVTIRTNGQK